MSEAVPIIIEFSRREVEALDMRLLLQRFGKNVLPRGQELSNLMGRFNISVHGYDEDPEEVYAIEAIRTFYQKLRRKWPYWFFFCDLRGAGLKMMTACCMKKLTGAKHAKLPTLSIVFDFQELADFVYAGFVPMNKMFDRAGMSDRANYDRTGEIMRYFNFPFDVPPPE